MSNGENLVKRFEYLKEKNEELKSSKIVLETKISSKKEELETLKEEIFQNFKVETVQEARELLTKCKSKLAEKITELEEKMRPFTEQTAFEGEPHEDVPF